MLSALGLDAALSDCNDGIIKVDDALEQFAQALDCDVLDLGAAGAKQEMIEKPTQWITEGPNKNNVTRGGEALRTLENIEKGPGVSFWEPPSGNNRCW